jgi:hypothetical protein
VQCDGDALDTLTFREDRLGSFKIDVSGREVVDALMVADVIVVLDEGIDLLLEISWQIVVFEQNAVLQGLMPTLDLSLSLGVIGCSAHMRHVFALEPRGQIFRDVT